MQSESQPRALVTPDDLLGFEIDHRYRLDAIVGGGGMGVVYRTTQHNLNREIAIKVLKLDDADGKNRLDRFKREIDIIAQLSHPNIVRVFDTGQDPILGLHYIAMELVEGAALSDVMRDCRMKPVLAIDIAYEVAAALTEPHKLGIVHRDIKPANVLLTQRSDDTIGVKVVDFGIARGQSTGNSKITTTGVVVGSPMYMAPEVARGETLDGRTDLYSLGVLMYEMLTGDTPFRGSTPVAIMLRHAVEEPPSLADAVSDDFAVPELVELVDAMLSKEKKRRPDHAKAVMRRLEEIRAIHSIPGRVNLESDGDLTTALADYLVPVTIIPDEIEPDAYGATTPIDAASREPSDSFHGWLVSDDARAALEATLQSAPPPALAEQPTETVPKKSKLPSYLAAAATAAIGVGVAVWGLSDAEPDANAEQPVELGTPPPIVEAAPAEPTATAEDDAKPAAQVVDAGSVDLQQHDASTDEAPAQPVAKTAPAQPRANATKKTAEKDDESSDEFEAGMEWLDKK